MSGGVVAELQQLGGALARDHEHRSRSGDDEEPLGDGHTDGDASGDRAQDESGCDRGEVEDGLVLQPDAVRDGERGVGGDDDGEPPGGGERQGERGNQ